MRDSIPVNVAVIGLGWWGQTIVDLLGGSGGDHKRLRVVRVADPGAHAAAFAQARGLPLARDLHAVLDDPQVQAVVLCTPHSQHAAQIVTAARAGKHVFCEKPLALSRADALRALAAVQDAGVALAVGHEKRFEPPVVEVMRMLQAGELGTPLQVEANFSQDKFLALPADNWRLSGSEAPAGPMTATGVHLLDLAVGVFGEADSVHASVKQLGSALTNGDTLAALVTFKRGGHALISAMLATPFAGRFAVYGSLGWAEVRDKTHPESPQGWTLTTCLRGQQQAVRREFVPASSVLANLQAFADAANGGAPYPVPREQMLANVSALEAVFRSAASGAIERVDNGVAQDR